MQQPRYGHVRYGQFRWASRTPVAPKGRMAKIVLDYSGLTDTALSSKALGMVNGLKDNPNFALPWPSEFPTLADLTTTQADFAASIPLAADRDKGKVSAKNALRAQLLQMIREIGRYVQQKSGGDQTILEGTGYDLVKEKQANPDIPAAPQNFKVTGGNGPGTAKASAEAPDGAVSFELQACTGDTSVEANWKTIAQTAKCRKIEVSGLERGKDTTFRLRAIGKKGPGPWSDIFVYMPN